MAACLDLLQRGSSWGAPERGLGSPDGVWRVPPSPQAETRPDPTVRPKDGDLQAAVEVLRRHDLHLVLEEWFLEVLQTDLQANVGPEFWNGIAQQENLAEEQQCSLLLLDAFSLLQRRLDPYLCSMELMESWTQAGLLLGTGSQGLREKVYTMFRAILFFSTTKTFQELIQQFYSRSFKIYMRQWKRGEGDERGGEAEKGDPAGGGGQRCAGCSCKKDRCWCLAAMEQFQQLSRIL